MIDLAALSGLFGEAIGAVAQLDQPDDIEKEKVFYDLKAAGHELIWVPETRVRQLKQEGWRPVGERDDLRRLTIFTDNLEELVLVHRPPRTRA